MKSTNKVVTITYLNLMIMKPTYNSILVILIIKLFLSSCAAVTCEVLPERI